MNDAKNLAKTATTIASYSLAIQKALEANGYDAEDIFEAAGIGRVPGPDPMDRLTTAELAAARAADATAHHGAHHRVANHRHARHFAHPIVVGRRPRDDPARRDRPVPQPGVP